MLLTCNSVKPGGGREVQVPPQTLVWLEAVQEISTRQTGRQVEEKGLDTVVPNDADQTHSPTLAPAPQIAARQLQHSRESSMLRVTAENQSKASKAFRSWHEVAGT
jgi:hypothetical protein